MLTVDHYSYLKIQTILIKLVQALHLLVTKPLQIFIYLNFPGIYITHS